ncbi:MAG TPA: hypothetical protein P5102_09305 [Candidatus Competibacteraceae bacterium]|nr:hypothetical protein [Candidatus Competibacteraceae bacterium]HSA45529.1 hypothetical protein [Candidatus Competibacteraceae bacterium]
MALNAPITAHSQAAFQQGLTLGTHIAIKTYNRTLNRVDAALYLTTIISRLQGRASRAFEPEIAQVSEAIAHELRRLENFLDHERRAIQKLFKAALPLKEPRSLIYTQPVEVLPRVRTPQASDYIRLIGQLEQTIRQLDQLWALGALIEVEHLQRQNELFRSFIRVCQGIERLARGLARRVQGQDREGRGVYRDMLMKRTGRSPGQEKPESIPAEESENMTGQEAASLVEMETLAFHWSATSPETDPAADPEAPPSSAAPAPDSSASAFEAPVADRRVWAAEADAPESGSETVPASVETGACVSDAASVVEAVTTDPGVKPTRRPRIGEILAAARTSG